MPSDASDFDERNDEPPVRRGQSGVGIASFIIGVALALIYVVMIVATIILAASTPHGAAGAPVQDTPEFKGGVVIGMFSPAWACQPCSSAWFSALLDS